jgi:DNA-binding response OmpR family regulator
MAGELILLVDDEPHILELAGMYLKQDGFQVTKAGDGQKALDAVRSLKPALIVLDLMLPVLDGLEVCRTLRQQGDFTPIIMLTARDQDLDKILGLELGADDYLTKPFNPRELIARIRAVLRRRKPDQSEKDEIVHLADLTIDPAAREVTISGQEIRLRAKEFDLLFSLARHQGIVLSRDRLLKLVWDYDYLGNTRTVDVHIGQLRKKISISQVKIETVTGVGYKLSTR